MQRITHGSNTIQLDEAALLAVEDDNSSPASALHPYVVAPAGAAAVAPAALGAPQFTYLFKDLIEKPEALLPDMAEAPSILNDLKDLGMSMCDVEHKAEGNSTIPSAYTYFGQFVDHDITFTDVKKPKGCTDAQVLGDDSQLVPLSLDKIHEIKNKRASILELDCVYGLMPSEKEEERRAPYRSESNPEMLRLSLVTESGNRPPGKTDSLHDLYRDKMSDKERGKFDRAAFIPDPRNDMHLIVSQLHVAFLRAHNELVRRGNSFEEARLTLRNCYHWLIVHDFLRRIANPDVVEQVLSSSEPLYDPTREGSLRLPLEFTAAVYRFGHSMVRNLYYISESAPSRSLGKLFMPVILGTGLKPSPGKGAETLPEEMIIKWETFLPGSDNINKARQMNTRMVEPLYALLDERALLVEGERSLAVQDLKRGYMLKLPTGQAIAEKLKIPDPLARDQIENLARSVSTAQLDALTRKETKLSDRTPLWFYVLAEAKISAGGNRLGPVGSRLVAEVFIGLIRRIPDSYLNTGWKPGNLGFRKDEFDLTDLLRLANAVRKNF